MQYMTLIHSFYCIAFAATSGAGKATLIKNCIAMTYPSDDSSCVMVDTPGVFAFLTGIQILSCTQS